ncbi:restriction endonuclease subunit S [Burkholderia gladioli]|uniref:restriction endonuclease subunit S n=1 Tax=Burkholderia gladioli TaxID=28095 RepID=UPI00163EA0ED|nr:restriction endonuclease subunit S [Burkholderia gladioli]
MRNFPKGWSYVRFSDVADINPRKSTTLDDEDEVTFIPMAAVSEITGTIVNAPTRRVKEVRKGFMQFIEGDVIFAKITPSMENGKSAIAVNLQNGTGFGSTEFHVLRSRGAVLPQYLWRYVRQKSFRENAQKVMSGAVGQQRVPADYLKSHQLPLPPLAEQNRIVAKIDSLSARTTRARADLECVPALLDKLRSLLIQAALTGGLTAAWRTQSLHSAGPEESSSTLTAAIAQRAKSKRNSDAFRTAENSLGADVEIPDGWTTCYLEDVTALRIGYAFKSQWFSEDGVPLVRGVNVAPGSLDWRDERRIPEDMAKKYERFRLEEGDIVLAMDRPLISTGLKIAMLKSEDSGALLVQRVANLRPNEFILNKFLYFALLGPNFIRQIRDNATGSDLPHISGKDILTTPLNLPPLREQVEIVRCLETMFDWIDRASSDHAAAMLQLSGLDAAILSKAFRGELLPQDINDEPAATLLTRIHAEQVALPRNPPRQRTPKESTMKTPKDLILRDSGDWPEKGIPFEEVARRNRMPYEEIRDALFALLAEENPRIRQIFDKETKCMHFKQVKA